jgi:hypothetical protein
MAPAGFLPLQILIPMLYGYYIIAHQGNKKKQGLVLECKFLPGGGYS